MVELEEKIITEVIKGFSDVLVTKDGERIEIEPNRLDMDFKSGKVQVVIGNYESNYPTCLAVFYDERRIYPLI